MAEGGLAEGSKAIAVIRMERVRLADAPGDGRHEMSVEGSIYLGDRWEHRLRRGELQLRAQGDEPINKGRVWCQIPPEHVWIFAGD